MDRRNGTSALWCNVDNAAVPARSKRDSDEKWEESLHGFGTALTGMGLSGVYGRAPGKLLRSVCAIGGAYAMRSNNAAPASHGVKLCTAGTCSSW